MPSFPSIVSIAIDPSTGAGNNDVNSISPIADEDFFSIVAPLRARSLTVTMDPDDLSLIPYLRLYDPSGNCLAASHGSAGGQTVTATLALVSAGQTIVIGAGNDYLSTGPYDIDVQFQLYDVPLTVPALEYYGPVNKFGDRAIAAEFLIDYAGDQDRWRFATADGGVTVFTATAVAGVNPLLALYDGTGALVSVANTGSGATETLTHALNADEVYTILVQDAEQDSTGDVDVTIDSPAATAPPIALNGAGVGGASGFLDYGATPAKAEPDYFQFTAPANSSGRLVLTAKPVEAFRLEFQLFDSTGAAVGSSYASPSDGAAAMNTYDGLTPGQEYHVCVFSYRFGDHAAGGDYSISADFEMRPLVAALSPSSPYVIRPADLTLTATGVSDADGNLDRVRFYRDANGNQTYDAGIDAYLGEDTNGADGWSWTGATGAMPYGRLSFFAVASDLAGSTSVAAACHSDICPSLPGDANNSGLVDMTDYIIWFEHFGGSGGWAGADFDFSGLVDMTDYIIWFNHFGEEYVASGPMTVEASPCLALQSDPAEPGTAAPLTVDSQPSLGPAVQPDSAQAGAAMVPLHPALGSRSLAVADVFAEESPGPSPARAANAAAGLVLDVARPSPAVFNMTRAVRGTSRAHLPMEAARVNPDPAQWDVLALSDPLFVSL